MRSFAYTAAGLLLLLAVPSLAGPRAPTVCAEDDPACANVVIGSDKFAPGHYMTPFLGDGQGTLLGRAQEVCGEPALRGMELRVYWAKLESAPGQFTFDDLEQIYDRLAACKKRLIVEVLAVKFGGTPTGIVPPDLEAQLVPMRQGYIATLWEPAVMDRFVSLYTALAEEFDNEPYFEGVIVPETATGGVASGYTVDGFIGEMTRGVKAIRAAWAHSTVLVFNNYIQQASIRQAADFVRAMNDMKVGIGGPDVFPPPHNSTIGEKVYRGEFGGTDYRGKMLAGFSVQTPELGGDEGTFTPQQLYDHCTVTNKCRYMFWIRNTSTGGPDQQWTTGILPFIHDNPAL